MKILKYLFILLTLWFVAHTVYIFCDGFRDENQKADIAVILGSTVNEDGTLSTRLQKRLEYGLQLYKNHRVKKIIVSGGLGKEGFYEGTKMKEFLSQNGVPDSSIIIDNQGNNTQATVENVLKLKDSLKFKSLIVVSQYFHISRTKMLFRKHNFSSVSGSSPNYFEIRDLYSVPREFVAFYVQ
jgi:vancomycin permeability regulator SanA